MGSHLKAQVASNRVTTFDFLIMVCWTVLFPRFLNNLTKKLLTTAYLTCNMDSV
jgi:hypothetical protein